MHALPSQNNELRGWVLIVPRTWGQIFLTALTSTGLKAIGLKERQEIEFELNANRTLSPTATRIELDWIDTNAYRRQEEYRASLLRAKWLRTPPNKRIHYRQFLPTPLRPLVVSHDSPVTHKALLAARDDGGDVFQTEWEILLPNAKRIKTNRKLILSAKDLPSLFSPQQLVRPSYYTHVMRTSLNEITRNVRRKRKEK